MEYLELTHINFFNEASIYTIFDQLDAKIEQISYDPDMGFITAIVTK